MAIETEAYILKEAVISFLTNHQSEHENSRKSISSILKFHPVYANNIMERFIERDIHLIHGNNLRLSPILSSLNVTENLFSDIQKSNGLLSYAFRKLKNVKDNNIHQKQNIDKLSLQLLGGQSVNDLPWKQITVLFILIFLYKVFENLALSGLIVQIFNVFFFVGFILWYVYLKDKE